MNYYYVPGTGIFGGIKTAAQFVELLCDEGVPACLVTPEGGAPQWFHSRAPVIPAARMKADWSSRDALFFSCPHDYPHFQQVPPRVFFHCQGTVPAIDPILHDPEVTLLTAWPQARDYVFEKTGRSSLDTGIAVSDVFFYRGRPKFSRMAACMPRRGAELIEACAATCPSLDVYRIQDRPEADTADLMQAAEYYLATSVNEGFGLPALEAMAAGALVVSVPVLGGEAYLRPDQNCVMAPPDDLAAALRHLCQPTEAARRARLRDCAMATAGSYTLSKQRATVRRLLNGPLKEVAGG